MTASNFEPTLYIIMRKDIPDMNPGKGMAQAAHADAEFKEMAEKSNKEVDRSMYEAWKGDRAFGRTIVLEGTEEEYSHVVLEANNNHVPCGIVYDPTYPITNYYGYTYTVGMNTCAWVFVGDEYEYPESMRDLKLQK